LNAIAIDILKKVVPYLIAFLLGVILTWKGCGSSEDSAEAIIKNPVGEVEYVDRWNTDTVRFVKTVVRRDVIRDTITQIVSDIRLDTITVVDTVSIVEAWLTELVKYDTAVTLNGVNVALKWQNYQNLSEQLSITVQEKVVGAKFALGIHANVGLLSNFKDSHIPLMGVGLQATINKGYYGIDYGFNGDHYVGLKVGRNIISR
jgi:PBP1b-binding outer membrane lipoprotein LpoB